MMNDSLDMIISMRISGEISKRTKQEESLCLNRKGKIHMT